MWLATLRALCVAEIGSGQIPIWACLVLFALDIPRALHYAKKSHANSVWGKFWRALPAPKLPEDEAEFFSPRPETTFHFQTLFTDLFAEKSINPARQLRYTSRETINSLKKLSEPTSHRFNKNNNNTFLFIDFPQYCVPVYEINYLIPMYIFNLKRIVHHG